MRKTFAIVALVLVLFHGKVYANVPTYTVEPMFQRVTMNEEPTVFTAYNINGSNYFNLSELSAAFQDTTKSFSVNDDSTVMAIDVVDTLSATDEVNSFNEDSNNEDGYTKTILYMDTEFVLPTYKVNGEHYCKLRTISDVLDFAVDWNPNNNTINIDVNRTAKDSITVEKIVPKNPKIYNEMKSRAGMIGRWQMPSVGIDVALFNSGSQETVDNVDSAAYFRFGTMYTIADHSNQKFKVLNKCEVGDKAFIDNGLEKVEYVCTAKFKGHNTTKDLTDENYNTIKYSNEGGITCYTCDGGWQNIWVLFFQPA